VDRTLTTILSDTTARHPNFAPTVSTGGLGEVKPRDQALELVTDRIAPRGAPPIDAE
jgi:hypothetical protein